MKGRKKGLRAISWVLIFAMVIQMMSSDLITIAKAMPADGISAEVTELSSEVSGNTADESVVPSEQANDEIETEEEEKVEAETEAAEFSDESIALSCTENSSKNVKLTWTVEDASKAASYDVYKEGAKIANVEASEETTYIYEDKSVAADSSYTYQVFGLDADGKKVTGSKAIVVEIIDDLTISSNYTLTENKTVRNLTINNYNATLNLGEYALTVLGNVTISAGAISFGKGYLECQNFSMTGYRARLIMNDVNALLKIKGNFIYQGGYNTNTLSAGTIELAGDFTGQTNYNGFNASGTHTLVLNGDEKQTITFNENYSNYFNIVEVDNQSKEGVYFKGYIAAADIHTNGCNFSTDIANAKKGWLLEEDETYDGDLILASDTLDLNGHTLTIKGSLIQAGGTVDVNGGCLKINQDYYVEYKTNDDGSDVLKRSCGRLIMDDENDQVYVAGKFEMASMIRHNSFLTNGKLYVAGDLEQKYYGNNNNFYATENFTLVLNGTKAQDVKCSTNSSYYLHVPNLVVTNSSEEGVNIPNGPLYVTKSIQDHGNIIHGKLVPYGNVTFVDGTYAGDLNLSEYVNLQNDVTVKGNLNITSSYFYLLGHKLTVEGDLTVSGGSLVMSYDNDYVLVKGNMVVSGGTSNYANGTLELKGNFTQTATTGTSIIATNQHITIFSGSQKQTVTFNSPQCYFNKVILKNTSEEGIYAPKGLNANLIETNGCKVTGDGTGIMGFELSEDTTLTGDIILNNGVMNLNGHSLTVSGNLIQTGGTMNVNGGSLIIHGDYRLEKEEVDEEDNVTYSASSGALVMTKAEDHVIVDGNFVMGASASESGRLTAGTLEVKGNVTQRIYGNSANFATSDSFKLLLNGTKEQVVTIPINISTNSPISNLEILNEAGVSIPEGSLYVLNTLNDHGNKVTGKVIPGYNISFVNNHFSGSLDIRSSFSRYYLPALTIDGDIQASSYIYLYGSNLVVGGNLTTTSSAYIYLAGNSRLHVKGNLSLLGTSSSDYGLYYDSTNSYVLVEGDMYVKRYGRYNYMSYGTLELKGDFTQENYTSSYTNFIAGASHTTILSGDKKQTVTFNNPSATFGKLSIMNTSKEGIYAPNGLNALEITTNGCKVDCGQSGETGYTLTKDTEIDGDFDLAFGEMDLNGHTLHVKGNLTQSGGNMKIHGGILVVDGDYRIQDKKVAEDDTVTYSGSTGLLIMTDINDEVRVAGDFVMGSLYSSNGRLTAGKLDVKGNVTQTTYKSNQNFLTTSKFILELSGTKAQTVTFGMSPIPTSETNSAIANLVITNESEEGVTFADNIAKVTGHVKDNGHAVKGRLAIGQNTSFENNVCASDLYIPYSYTMQDDLTVNGNLVLMCGLLSLNGHNLHVKGNLVTEEGKYLSGTSTYNNQACLYMTNEKDYLLVDGDMTVKNYSNGSSYYMSAGVLELKGDFTQVKSTYASNTANFVCTVKHETILSGDKMQTVKFETAQSTFGTLILKNTSVDGVYFDCPTINALKLIQNDSSIHFNGNGITGYTLTDDTYIEGDLNLVSGDLDLNGYSLKVSGNLYVTGGSIVVNKGSLEVAKDLRIQAPTFDADNKPISYSASTGALQMQDEEDYVLVKGSFVSQSQRQISGLLTAGTLEVKGNFEVTGSYSYNFYATQNHKLILSGTQKQSVNVVNVESYCLINYLEIKNTSSAGVVNANGNTMFVRQGLWDEEAKLSKNITISMPNIDVIKSESCGASVILTNNSILTHDLVISGSITSSYSIDLAGYSLTTGNMTKSNGSLTVNGGNLRVIGNMSLSSYGCVKMTNAEDYICVTGNFSVSTYNNYNVLSAGTLEIRGDFTQSSYNNFAASSGHKTILSGKTGTSNRNYVQTITMNYSNVGTNHFGHVVLNKPLKYYRFTPALEDICLSYENEAKDDEAPEAVQNVQITDVTATKISLSWNSAPEEDEVTGYEIYRGSSKVGTTSRTTFTDSGLKPSTTYTYKVYAFDAMRNLSLASESVSAMTKPDLEAPTVPASVKIKTKTGSSVSVTWNASTDNVGVAGYNVYRDGELVATLGATTLYKDTDVEMDELYTYQVQAFDISENMSEKSEIVRGSVAMPEILRLAPADNAVIGGGKTALTVYYKNVGNATGNKVKFEYEKTNGAGEKVWEQIGGVTYGQQTQNASTLYSTCSWDYRNVPNGNCNMRVTLIDADGNTDVEEYVLNIDTEGPKATDSIQGECIQGITRLTWSASDSADCVKYNVYKSTTENGIYTLIATIDGVRYEDKAVKEGNTYYYRVSGVDKFNQEGPKSDLVSVEITKDDVIPVVYNISAGGKRINGIANITVEASDNRGVQSIILDYLDPETEEWVSLGEKETEEDKATFSWDTRELADGDYTLRAVAVDTTGNRSDGTMVVAGEEIKAEPFSVITKIDNTGISKINVTSAVGYPTYVTLKWDTVEEEDFHHFVVEQKSGSDFNVVATSSTTLGAHIQNLMLNTEYTFRVVGYDDLGNRGIPSDEVVVTTTKDDQKPIITGFGPAEKYFAKQIPLSINVKDNVGVKSLKLCYSVNDGEWQDMTTIMATQTTKQYTFNYAFDVSSLEEGEVSVRAYAYDIYDNESSFEDEPIINNFFIDRTAPSAVTGLKAQGMAGYNAITWDKMPEDDLREFRLYRAEEEIGNYSLLADGIRTNMYYDTTAKIGVVYTYKVLAVDLAGNVGDYSVEAVAQSYVDDEKPVVQTISPKADSKITGEVTIEAFVTDNVGASQVQFEYKLANSTEDIWTDLATVELSSPTDASKVKWDVSKFDNVTYVVRVTACDASGNYSDPFEAAYKVDTKAPNAPTLVGDSIGFGAILAWDANEEADFDRYEIYRKLGSDDDYQLITTTTENRYEDDNLLSGRKYLYKVRAYDDASNYGESNVVTVTPTNEDKQAPVAIASETLSVREGSELALDGTASYDNVKIVKYEWDMGNGDKVYGANAKYTYDRMGTYNAKLTVTDSSGNTASTDITVFVRSRISAFVDIKVTGTVGSTDVILPYSYIYIESELGEKENYTTDATGAMEVVLSAGTYTVNAYAEGYLPKSFTVTLEKGEDKELLLPLEKGELVTGSLTTKRLTLQQMRDLGVDLQDPNNWITYVYKITYTPVGSPVRKTVEVELREGTTVYIGDGYSAHLTKVHDTRVVTLYRTETFLKKMYDVCLTITNHAEEGHGFDIENSTAKLNLPSGLSLLTINRAQSLVNNMGVIHAQETKSTHWYIRADRDGTYNLSSDFTGSLQPFDAPVKTTITAKPLVVTKDEDNTFTDAGFVTDPHDYIIRISNKQGKRIKGAIVTLQANGKQCQTITNARGVAKLEVNKNESRCFRLTIEAVDYPLYIDESYCIDLNYSDSITLYREGEEPDEDDLESDDPYSGYEVPIRVAKLDGTDMLRTPRTVNMYQAMDHSMQFQFGATIKSYELSVVQDIYGTYRTRRVIKSGENEGNLVTLSFSNDEIPVEGQFYMTIVTDSNKEISYPLQLKSKKQIFEHVYISYDGKRADLMEEVFTLYSYYKDTKFSLTIEPVRNLDADMIGSFTFMTGGKKLRTVDYTSGSVTISDVKIRELNPKYENKIYAYDKNGTYLTYEPLSLTVEDSPVQDGEEINFASTDDEFSFTLPSDIPLIGGKKLSFNFEQLHAPMSVRYTTEGALVEFELLNKKIFEVKDKVEVDLTWTGSGILNARNETISFNTFIKVTASGGWEWQVWGPIVVAVDVEGYVGADGTVTLYCGENVERAVSGAISLLFGAELELFAGVGAANVASIGVYGSAGIDFSLALLPVEDIGFDKITLSGAAGVEGRLFGGSIQLELIDGEFVLYNRQAPSGDYSIDTMSTDELIAALQDAGNYIIEARGDVSDRSVWNGTVSANSINVLQYNSHDELNASMASLGDKTILLFTDDDVTKEVQNASTLCYAVYGEDGFAKPVKLSASANAQHKFDTYEAEDGIYVVWQEAKNTLDQKVSIKDVATSLELKVAKIDSTGAVTDLGTITDNAKYEAEPRIIKEGEKLYVTWYENSEDDVFGAKGINTLKKAELSNGVWTISELAGNIGQAVNLDLGFIGNSSCVAYALDTDTKIIRLSDGKMETLEQARNAQLGYVAGKQALVWLQDGKLYATDTFGSYDKVLFDDVKVGLNNYHYISDANGNSTIVYTVKKDGKTEIYLSDYDAATDLWGNAQKITDQGAYLEHLTGAYHNGELLLAFNQTTATLDKDLLASNNIPTKTNFCSMRVEKNGAIKLVDVTFDSKQAIPGGKVDLDITLENTGIKSVPKDDVMISVLDESGAVVAKSVASVNVRAGGMTQDEIVVTLPYTAAAHEYTVQVEYNGIKDEKAVVVGDTDLAIQAKAIKTGFGYTIEAVVENLGVEPSAGKVVFYDQYDQDKVLGERKIKELYYGETAEVIFNIDKEVYDEMESLPLGIKVVPSEVDADPDNNNAFIQLGKIIRLNTCSVTFNYGQAGKKSDIRYATSGECLEFPEEPVMEGYKFLGWFRGDEKFEQTTPVEEHMYLVAKYEKVQAPAVDPNTGVKPGDKPGDQPGTQTPAVPAKNAKKTVKGITYKVTKSDAKNGTVAVTKLADKKKKSLVIPDKVQIDGYTFKVTEISKDACKKMTKLTKVTIGKNVTKIGANAFSGCKKLNSVTIKSTKLKSVGKNAFKGISAKAKIKVPSKSLKKYKKLLKKSGLPKKAKIQK